MWFESLLVFILLKLKHIPKFPEFGLYVCGVAAYVKCFESGLVRKEAMQVIDSSLGF